MDHNYALSFLQRPFPQKLSPQQKRDFGDVLTFLHEHPIEAAIVPLFETIQDWDDLHLGECIVSYLRHFDSETVAPIIRRMLTHDREVVRMWASSAASDYPHESFLPGLATHMDSTDGNIRYSAACAIEQIGGPEAKKLARLYLPLEKDEQIYEALQATIEGK